MPIVRCPDCLRDITISQEDLTLVIECSVCEARFGPLVAPVRTEPAAAAAALPPPPQADDESPGPTGERRIRRKRVKPKPRLRFLPLLGGIAVGLGATAALVIALFIVIRMQPAAATHGTVQPDKALAPAAPQRPPATNPVRKAEVEDDR
jgi:hypothetical protein